MQCKIACKHTSNSLQASSNTVASCSFKNSEGSFLLNDLCILRRYFKQGHVCIQVQTRQIAICTIHVHICICTAVCRNQMIVTHSCVFDSPSDILGHNINLALKCSCPFIELTSSPQHLHQCVGKLSYATFPWCQIVYIYQSLSVVQCIHVHCSK